MAWNRSQSPHGQNEMPRVRQSRFSLANCKQMLVQYCRTLKQVMPSMLIGVLMVGLLGCAQQPDEDMQQAQLKLPVAVLKADASTADVEAYRLKMLTELQYANVDFKRLGHHATLVVSTDQLFVGKTSNLSSHAVETHLLQRLQLFLSTYDIDRMRISSYRNPVESVQIDQALADQQANLVEHTLAESLQASHRARFVRARGVVWPPNVKLADQIEIVFQFNPRSLD